ncbi:hypothetical protein BGX38DRAFT_1199257 [Terfezia claveryi]|nr:hypothetical protein BGX38DRAFT_1199257 [Terfezia claveryi]
MSQQTQPENVNQLSNPSVDPQVEGEGLLVAAPDQTQTISHKRSAECLSFGGDSIADLIRKAKASRTASGSGLKKVVENTEGGASVAIDTPMDESLESALSCPICSDYLYRPVAAISCLHTFCGSCLVPWLKRSSLCPNCRTSVTAIKDDHRTNNLLEMYLKLHPEKARTEEDEINLDKIYKPGNVVKILRAADDYSDEEGNDGDEDEEDPEDRMPPCDYCYPPEPLENGLACEHPIPPPPAPVDGIEYMEGVEHHRSCSACMRTMPRREGMACESCAYDWCGSLFECTRQNVLKRFEDIRPTPTIDGWAAYHNLFGSNGVERDIYNRWVQDSQLQDSDIVDRFKEWFLEEAAKVDYIAGVSIMRPTSQTTLCEACFLHWMNLGFKNWWINEKEKSGVVDNRPKCWYGVNCRTQGHNLDHATRLNHACHETPAEERYARRAPRAQQRPPLGGAGPARRASPPRHPHVALDAPVGVPVIGVAQPVAAINALEIAAAATVAAVEEEAVDIPTPGLPLDDY